MFNVLHLISEIKIDFHKDVLLLNVLLSNFTIKRITIDKRITIKS